MGGSLDSMKESLRLKEKHYMSAGERSTGYDETTIGSPHAFEGTFVTKDSLIKPVV